MSLTLYYHPLSSYCWKALIALYETGTAFTPQIVDLANPEENAALRKIWPMGRFPVLRDDVTGEVIPESTIIIEYLASRAPGSMLIPPDPELARETRLRDRLFDLDINNPMQRIVAENFRPQANKDPFGLAQARAQMDRGVGVADASIAGKTWAIGDVFTMADCAAAPALYYADRLSPFGDRHKEAGRYLGRLTARPSFARVLAEAEPYFKFFPGNPKS
jgi:glutathione S-transferase